MKNLLTSLPLDRQTEACEDLIAGGDFRVERIVSHGHVTPPNQWYDQDVDEWVLVLTGSARLTFEGDSPSLAMGPGDCVNIPARQKHRVEWTDPSCPTVWLAIHYQPRTAQHSSTSDRVD